MEITTNIILRDVFIIMISKKIEEDNSELTPVKCAKKLLADKTIFNVLVTENNVSRLIIE